MCGGTLEQRISRLETALERFDGVQWIVRVGEIARLKAIIMDLSEEAGARCRDRLGKTGLARIDRAIAIATDKGGTDGSARDAFAEATWVIGGVLEPEAPGKPAKRSERV